MQPSKKFAFDACITFFASIVTLPPEFVIPVALGRHLGAGVWDYIIWDGLNDLFY